MRSLLPASVVWTTIRVASLSWLFLRGILAFGTRSAQNSISGALVVIVVVAAAPVIDLKMTRERTWLGNLGVGRRQVALFALGLAVLLELAAGLLARTLGGSG